MGIEKIPQHDSDGLDLRKFLPLQAALLRKNHPDWDGLELGYHMEEMEKFGEDFRAYVNEHPEVLEEFMQDEEGTIKKLKDKFYH